MDFTSILHRALGIPDAIPPERRLELAKRIIFRRAQEQRGVAPGDVYEDEAVEVGSIVERAISATRAAFEEGELDRHFVGLPTRPTDADRAVAERIVRAPQSWRSNTEELMAIVTVMLEPIVEWLRATTPPHCGACGAGPALSSDG